MDNDSYNREDFYSKSIKIKNISSLGSKLKNADPYLKFYVNVFKNFIDKEWFELLYGKEKNRAKFINSIFTKFNLSVSDVYVSKELDEALIVLTKSWLRAAHNIKGKMLRKYAIGERFNIGPAVFSKLPEWADKHTAYIRKPK